MVFDLARRLGARIPGHPCFIPSGMVECASRRINELDGLRLRDRS